MYISNFQSAPSGGTLRLIPSHGALHCLLASLHGMYNGMGFALGVAGPPSKFFSKALPLSEPVLGMLETALSASVKQNYCSQTDGRLLEEE